MDSGGVGVSVVEAGMGGIACSLDVYVGNLNPLGWISRPLLED